MSKKIRIAAIFLALGLCPSIGAATLQPETVSACHKSLADEQEGERMTATGEVFKAYPKS